MLTTATILMSPGTDSVNAHHVPSAKGDIAGISFAKSFDEGSALAGEMQMQAGDGRTLKDAVDAEGIAPAKNVGVPAALTAIKVKADVNGGDKIQNELGSTKSLIPPVSAKSAGSISGGVTTTATGGVLPHSGKSKKDTSIAIQVKVPDGQLSSGDVKDVAQKSAHGAIDGAKTDAEEGVAALPMDVAASAMPPIPDNGEKPMIRNKKEMLSAEKNQETIPVKKLAKGDDGIVKTENAAKTEEKIEKTTGTPGNSVGIEARAVVTVPVIVLPVDGQQHGVSATPDNAFSSVASATTGLTVGMTEATGSKAVKRPPGAGKADGDNVKTVVPALSDDPASRKGEIDGAKTASSAERTTDADNAKGQNGVAAVATTGLTHAESGAAGIAFGSIPGSAAVHVVAARSQAMETNSHAATVQAGSGAIDTAGPIDATHKTLMATPTTLEVGVANGTHGWLKIRAEMTGGGVVNASLSTASSSGQEMLHRELPSLTAYLQSERVAVNTVVVQPGVTAGAGFRELAGGMNGDGGGQAQQSGAQGGENRQDTASAVLNRTEKDVPYNGMSGVGGDELLSSTAYAGGGSWLSVRA